MPIIFPDYCGGLTDVVKKNYEWAFSCTASEALYIHHTWAMFSCCVDTLKSHLTSVQIHPTQKKSVLFYRLPVHLHELTQWVFSGHSAVDLFAYCSQAPSSTHRKWNIPYVKQIYVDVVCKIAILNGNFFKVPYCPLQCHGSWVWFWWLLVFHTHWFMSTCPTS